MSVFNVLMKAGSVQRWVRVAASNEKVAMQLAKGLANGAAVMIRLIK